MPEFIDPRFRENKPKTLVFIENERFGLVFAKTVSIISGTGVLLYKDSDQCCCIYVHISAPRNGTLKRFLARILIESVTFEAVVLTCNLKGRKIM